MAMQRLNKDFLKVNSNKLCEGLITPESPASDQDVEKVFRSALVHGFSQIFSCSLAIASNLRFWFVGYLCDTMILVIFVAC